MILSTAKLKSLSEEFETAVQKNQEMADAVREYAAAQEHLEALIAKYPDLAEKLNHEHSVAAPPRRGRRTRTPRNQIAEEILRESGRPMHASTLLERMKERGVTFKGKTSATDQLRSALAKSKRFRNLGSNNWWLDGVPSPDELLDNASATSERQDLPLTA